MDRPTWGPHADADSLRDPQTLNQASSQPPLCPDFQRWIRWSLIKKGEKLKKKKKKLMIEITMSVVTHLEPSWSVKSSEPYKALL